MLSLSRLCRMFLGNDASFLAALLFAVHPVHTEAVSSVYSVVTREDFLDKHIQLDYSFRKMIATCYINKDDCVKYVIIKI